MSIKTKIKNSTLFPLIVYLQYLANRYFIQRAFRSLYLAKEINLESIDDGITFFGYYNISPSNNNGDIIYLKVTKEKVRGSLYEPASIMLKNANGAITKIAETKAWNWQQGCMLQWYSGTDDTIIYNDYYTKKERYISVIKNIKTGRSRIIDKPIYSVAKTGEFALTLNFERLAKMRPDYGYFNRNVRWDNMPEDSKDGIWYVDLMKNESKLILSLEQLKNFHFVKTMIGARHKVNHIDIAPNGKRFMFLHRWVGPHGRFMRLLTANSKDGSDLYYLTGDEMVSHNCWWGNEDIISFCRLKDGRERFVHFKDKQGYLEIIGEKYLIRDGHPSVSPNGKWMLTDDYPDKARFSRIYLFDLENNTKYIVGEFFQPFKYKKEKRIDLHPKWSNDGRAVFFESGHEGHRTLYKMNICGYMNNKLS
ncbi:MAG: TolB family protein [Promethearchaeota archaeon]